MFDTFLTVTFILFGLAAIAVILIRFSAPHLFRFSKNIAEKIITSRLEELQGAVFIPGMKACENLYLDPNSRRFYVTDLAGFIYLIDGENRENMQVVKSKQVGNLGLGIDRGSDGYLYVGASEYGTEDWIKKGGAIYKLDLALETMVKMTGEYPGLNGLTFDDSGGCYFASSNFNFVNPKGSVYRMQVTYSGSILPPEVFIADVGIANGLYYDRHQNLIYFSNTLEGIFTFEPSKPTIEAVYYKTKFLESTDDLCADRNGRVWMTDPGKSSVKMYDPTKKILIRYAIAGIGQTSSCRIREENGEEVIYITEIKQNQNPLSKIYDGRGIAIVPLDSLLRLLPIYSNGGN